MYLTVFAGKAQRLLWCGTVSRDIMLPCTVGDRTETLNAFTGGKHAFILGEEKKSCLEND